MGRLKLREIKGQPAYLIAYARPNVRASRQSDYSLLPVDDPAGLKALLAACLGVRSIVRKRRELLTFKNVRIHLDRVHQLGEFGELEAVIGASPRDGETASRKRIDELVVMLGIRPCDLLANSYGEMMANKNARRHKQSRRAL